jgi:hypothetical protein
MVQRVPVPLQPRLRRADRPLDQGQRPPGRQAAWSRTEHELTVTPAHGLRKGRKFTTVVRYDGVPITQEIVLGPGFTIEAGFIHTDDGAIVAGQPEVAASWFPVNDHPIDKASYTFVVTAPAGLEVVANGRLLARKRHGAKRTWLWHAPEPMASYLATVNIGQFDTRRYRTPDGLWMYDALDPDLFTEPVGGPGSPTFGEIADGSFARQAEIIDFLEERFSRYPFSTGGGIVDDYDNLQFALETQTRSIYSKLFFTSPPSGDSVVVHEIAHQWFGDSVALAEWKHIWLNEGFAQYSEWMWSEEEGLETAQEQFDAVYNGIPATDPFWSVVIGDPGPQLLFDNAVYFRGAMAVHQLRLAVGDRDFSASCGPGRPATPAATAPSPSSCGWPSGSRASSSTSCSGCGCSPAASLSLRGPPRRRSRQRRPGRRAGPSWSGCAAEPGRAQARAPPAGPGRSPLAARRAVSVTRLARVSGRLAWTIHSRAARRSDRGKPSHCSRAPGWSSKAAARSAGTIRSSTASSIVHDPSRLASSINASPGSAKRPSASSRSIRTLFVRAQPLPRLRGENRSFVRWSSSLAALPSIHPKHRASWTASS